MKLECILVGTGGGVSPEDYDEVLRRLERAKARFLDREASTDEERKAWEKVWPFEDRLQ